MRILIAPNALKDSLSAADAALAIERGIKLINSTIETICVPIADGGDGLLVVVEHALNGEWKSVVVSGPLGQSMEARFLYCPTKSLAIVELAAAAGLALLNKGQYNIREASTYGVGQLISAALELDIKHLILGIGGSATNDAAMGIAASLGVRFLDAKKNVLAASANNLKNISSIDTDSVNKKLGSIQFDIVCDVNNPLLGDYGAAAVFGPQKGATPEDVIFLENGLSHFADIIQATFQKDIRSLEGGGAAGGVGAGLSGIFNVRLCRGADLVLDLLGVKDKLKNVDLLITTEGKLDSQTSFGKAPYAVAKLAKKHSIPVFIIAGQAEKNCQEYLSVFDRIITLTSTNVTSDYAISHAAELLQKSAEEIIKDMGEIA